MDPGDLIFYGIIAISVVSSIVKAVKKKPGDNVDTGMPDFKGSRAEEIFKTVLEDLREKDDDFIPSNPKPVPPIVKVPVPTLKVEPLKRSSLAADFERMRTATENMPRRESFSAKSSVETEGKPDELSDSILQSIDLRQTDELKKAIIYSEILRPKF